MDITTQKVIEESVAASYAGTRDFPTHVATVADRGIESYRVDFRQLASTYFLPSGEWHTVRMPAHPTPIQDSFDAAQIIGAIRAIQQQRIQYREFVDRVMSAGCVGYVTWIAGRHVTYFGRRGEVHVERFLDAKT